MVQRLHNARVLGGVNDSEVVDGGHYDDSEFSFGHDHDYVQIGGAIRSTCDLSETEIHNLIRSRQECRRKREFQGADKIQEELQQNGVAIHDDAKAWRADGGKTFPKKQNNRRITKRTRNKVPNMKVMSANSIY